MWTYSQHAGILTASDGSFAGQGYSGHGAGINNPALQNMPDVGPIPQGFYTMSPFFSDSVKGPLVCNLEPDATNQMFGRSGFMMHGDSVEHPGAEEASQGCIIMSHFVRQAVSRSGDNRLQVVAV